MAEKETSEKKKFKMDKARALPFILTGLIILLDQISKIIIVKNWPRVGTIIKDVFNNGFLIFCHVRNPDIAFSLGRSMPGNLKPVLFIVIPVLVLGFVIWYYLKSDDFTRLQRWAVAGIIGGGIGNLIDRIFRPDGVVDFINVKFFGLKDSFIPLLRWERWPVFNIADSSVVVCCIILMLTFIIDPIVARSKAKSKA